jgi:glycine/D-amino acid oxidase-like deaminating enzyme
MLPETRRIIGLPNWRIQRTWNGYYTQSKSQEIFQHSPDPRIHLVMGIVGKGITSACGFAKHHMAQLELG